MSFARWGADGSDVYLYPAREGYVCCACFTSPDVETFIAHIEQHTADGHHVPDYVIPAVRTWVEEQA